MDSDASDRRKVKRKAKLTLLRMESQPDLPNADQTNDTAAESKTLDSTTEGGILDEGVNLNPPDNTASPLNEGALDQGKDLLETIHEVNSASPFK